MNYCHVGLMAVDRAGIEGFELHIYIVYRLNQESNLILSHIYIYLTREFQFKYSGLVF